MKIVLKYKRKGAKMFKKSELRSNHSLIQITLDLVIKYETFNEQMNISTNDKNKNIDFTQVLEKFVLRNLLFVKMRRFFKNIYNFCCDDEFFHET